VQNHPEYAMGPLCDIKSIKKDKGRDNTGKTEHAVFTGDQVETIKDKRRGEQATSQVKEQSRRRNKNRTFGYAKEKGQEWLASGPKANRKLIKSRLRK